MQRVGRLVEPRNRRIAVLGQLADAVEGLLRQDHARLRPLQRRLARRDHLHAGADVDVGELRRGDDLSGERLLVLGNRFRIVDLDQHGTGGDVLAALDRDLAYPAVDTGRDVEPCRIDLALHEKRLGTHQVPDGQACDGGDHDGDDDRWHARGRMGLLLRLLLRCVLGPLGGGLRLGIRVRYLPSRTPLG